MSKWAENKVDSGSITDRGEGNDPKPLGLAFHHQGSKLLHLGNMGVMICLGQGGVRSQSACFLGLFIYF